MANELKIRVGAAIDASFNTVMASVVDSARKARKQINAETKASVKADVDVQKAASKEVAKLHKDETKTANAAMMNMVKDSRAFEKERTKDVRDAVKERIRLQRAGMREVEADLKRHAREQKKEAAEHAKANKSQSNLGLVGRSLILRGLNAAMTAPTRLVGSLLRGMGVDSSIQSQLGDAVAREQQAVNISNAAWIPSSRGTKSADKAARTKVDPEEIQKAAFETAQATAMSTADVQTGLEKFVAMTGDLQTARSAMGEIGRLAKANGADFTEMMQASAAISNSMGDIENKGPLIAAVMKTMAGQGQLGAVEIKDMARNMGFLTAQANNFTIDPLLKKTLEGQGVTNDSAQRIAVVGGLAQYARSRGGKVTAKTAMESAMAFTRDLSNPNEIKRMQAAGLTTFVPGSNNSQVRDPMQMIMEILDKGRGKGGIDLNTINNLVPNQRGRAVVSSIAQDYNEKYREAATKGITEETEKHKYAMTEVTHSFEDMLSVTQQEEETAKRFADAMVTAQSKTQILNNEFGNAAKEISKALIPAIEGLVPVVQALTPFMSGMIDMIADFTGVKAASDNAKGNRVVTDTDLAAGKLRQGVASGMGVDEETLTKADDAEKLLKNEVYRRQEKQGEIVGKYARPHGLGDTPEGWDQYNKAIQNDPAFKENTKALIDNQKRLNDLHESLRKANEINGRMGTGKGTREDPLHVVVAGTPPTVKPETPGTTSPESLTSHE